MWLVMEVEAGSGSLVPRCRPRRCADLRSVWDPTSCRCFSGDEVEVTDSEDTELPCARGEQLYLDIFGQGVCGCRPGHGFWPGDGDDGGLAAGEGCYQLGGRGPCQDDEAVFSLNPDTGLASCVGEDNNNTTISSNNPETTGSTKTSIERVFDIIPAGGGGNSVQHGTEGGTVKVTQESCVLDARGKCRRKVHLTKIGEVSNQADTFRSWLETFRARAPSNFQCAS